jgi:hypothetical protein
VKIAEAPAIANEPRKRFQHIAMNSTGELAVGTGVSRILSGYADYEVRDELGN